MSGVRSPRRLALPLGLQQLGLIIGALIVAQLVTLVLTVLIPPAPTQRWNLERVAQSLLGEREDKMLERARMAGPPDTSRAGWLVSESSRAALAKRLKRPESDVVLAFYTQLPVGGVTVPVNEPRTRLGQASTSGDAISQALLDLFASPAYAQAGPPGGPPPGGMPGGGFPGGGFPGGGPPGGIPGGAPPGGAGPAGPPPGRNPSQTPGQAPPSAGQPGQPGQAGQAANPATAPNAAPPPNMSVPSPNAAMPGMPAMPPAQLVSPMPLPFRASPAVPTDPQLSPGSSRQPAASTVPQPSPDATAPTRSAPPATLSSVAVVPSAQAIPPHGTPQPIPFRETQGPLSFTSPAFIEGDFIAAMREPDGSWIAVAPRTEPFPNRWQQRVMLWFALSLLIVAPLVWLFSRRIVKPLEGFARAAEALGRDPAASVMPLSGPAEIGRAARAFNQMRDRLRAFVDDRTAMVGAISHDLRTPLTRMRFRIEDVPDDLREDLLADVDEMELMIGQVIAFIRDASTPGPREQIDFAALVESVVANARVTGNEIGIEILQSIPVEVDPVGIRRLLTNLLENAVKYGDRARVRVSLQDERAVADIIDDGPGIPEEERERAFAPFFRCEDARESEKPGNGLGLAVCRSIARAHGGDVHLEQREEGFVARLILPSLYGDGLRKVA